MTYSHKMSEVRNRKLNVKKELKRLLEKLDKCEDFLRFLPRSTPSPNNEVYFDDGVRRIDFVLVYSYKSSDYAKARVNTFIRHLEKYGLEFEGCSSKKDPTLLFIKVHGETNMLIKRASIFDIALAFENENEFVQSKKWKLGFMYTELTRPGVKSTIYRRAPESVPGAKLSNITPAERIMLVYDLLKFAKFGPKSHEFGVDLLVKERSFVAAYPLHDGGYNWTEYGPLNDRQLLARFWGTQKYFYKYQPLDLIHKYYGPEVAFYFAFYGFYNKMLIWASLMGLLSIIYGAITFWNTDMNYVSKSICNSKAFLCPACHLPELCHFQEMKSYCSYSKISYILDNTGTFCYAILMCFWATLFIELWKRKQKTLMYKWNLLTVEDDPNLRNDYIIKATHWRKSRYEDRLVPFVKFRTKFVKYMMSYIIVQFFIIVMITVIYGTILGRLLLRYWLIKYTDHTSVKFRKVSIISTGVVTSIIITFMIMCELFYEVLAQFLTNYENPRTQTEYDKLFIYKQYTLFFLNAYGQLYYTSFFKGSILTYPGDSSHFFGMRITNADLCGPTGCILQISIQLLMTMFGKILVKSVINNASSFIRIFKRKKGKEESDYNLPFYESSLNDVKAGYYFLLKDNRDIIIQYGYIILFTAAFPLTPLLALICNLVDLRIDAYKFTKLYKRPVPVRTCGIGAWNSVLNTLTYIGVITNAFLIAFTTHFVPDMIKKLSTDYYNEDFVTYTFSNFSIDDFDDKFADVLKQKIEGKHCLYLGKRHPPNHKHQYQFTRVHWNELAIRFISVLILEVMVICFTAILAFSISDIPRPIKEYLTAKQKADQEKRQNELMEAFRNDNS